MTTTTQPPAPPTAAQAARQSIALNPVAVAWAAQMALVLLAGFGVHLTRPQAGAVCAIISALAGAVSAVTSRPWYIPAISGAAAAVLTACAAFGLKWTPEQVSAAAGTLGVILMLVTHQSVIPVSAARQGLTAHEIMLARLVRPPQR